ncbi:GH25 family lysozyme, partial [uncultured Streptococcus sp.]|uniref:GH25 family lysozyme n=1 Tax=uncultured Streptococcus sp. TaxID=83427 RepID=UPI0028E463FA
NLGSYTFNADQPVQQESSYFIDISSHNGVISVSEFLSLKSQGITGVVVKLTEGTSYTNPYESSQISNAQAAGLKVSAYHYSHYETAAEAKAEAQYFVSVAKSLGLSSSTVMVNDMESSEMLNGDINANTQAWKEEMTRLGYGDLVYYTMASWLDIKGGKVSTSTFGMSNFWVAHYVYGYTYLDQETAKSLAYYSSAAAWQYTSVSPKLSHALDENIDYTGRFTW